MPHKLTEQQQRFVQYFCDGMTQTQAARQAGYAHPSVAAMSLLKVETVRAAIRKEQDKASRDALMTRRRVIDGFLEAIEIARLQSEPATMVASWREIAKMCGYNAPETKKIDVTFSGAVHVSQIENMSDDELAKLIVEGDYTVHDDADDSEAALPALPAPSEDASAPDTGGDPPDA